jgi:hypothetical protein
MCPLFSTRCTGGTNIPSNVVDIYNVKSGAWTTAVLSVARSALAATSLPNDGVAMFAGGQSAFCVYYSSICSFCCLISEGGYCSAMEVVVHAECASSFTRCAVAGSTADGSNVVDIFDVRSGVWTTAALSAARCFLAATSLPNDGVAMFAGGWGELCSFHCLIAGGV